VVATVAAAFEPVALAGGAANLLNICGMAALLAECWSMAWARSAAGKREAWAKRGAAFFQTRSRRSASAPDRDTGGAATQPGSTQPSSGGTGAA
jgi:hypothetical protein